jgi:hypothetical protein
VIERPRADSLLMRQKLKLERPECFREDPQVKALIGMTWFLVEREDPDGTRADDHEDQGSFPHVRYRLAKRNEDQPNVAP